MTAEDERISFWEHVEELRKAILRIMVVVVVGMICSFVFYEQIFGLLTDPFKKIHQNKTYKVENRQQTQMPDIHSPLLSYRLHESSGSSKPSSNEGKIEDNLVIFSPAEGLMTVLKVSFWVGLVGTSPIWIFFLMQYIAPALYSNERKLLFPLLFLSLSFLTLGLLFAFFITIPTANAYLNAFNRGLGLNLWGLSYYLDYTLILLLANALAFELFVILFFFAHFRWISAKQMVANRKYVIVGFFILSALFTPPDILTQLLLALPLMVFYEAAILYARFRQRKSKQP